MRRLSKFEIATGILSLILLPLFLYCCALMFTIVLAPCRTINREIEEELSRIRAKGEPVTLKEMTPPAVPEDENAAFIYEKAFKKMEEIPKEIVGLLEKRPSQLTSGERITLKDFLAGKKEVFLLLEEAMTYERCRFPIDYEKGMLAELPHLSKLRDCARLLALKSLWELSEGKAEEALNTSLKMIRLSDSLSTEPILISQLVRIAIGEMMIDSLEKIFSEGGLSVETLRRLIDILNAFREETRAGLRLALLGERCSLFIAAFDPEKFFFVETGGGIPLSWVRFFMGSRFMRSDKLYGLRIYKKLIDFTRLPLHQAIRESKELKTEIDKRRDEAWERWERNELELEEFGESHILSMMLLPALGRSFIAWAGYEAGIEKARIAAALELYQREHKVYPEHLRDIPSRILSPLPQDPFTGEDFIYKRKNDHFLLYSVGENLQDDGGVASYIRVNRRRKRADLVWGHRYKR